MSDIAELELLIKKEKQRGDELDKQMTNEQRLLEEAEDKKCKIITRMLQLQLAELQEQNMLKEQQLMEIQKMKSLYFGGSIWVGGEICSKCKFFIFVLYFLIFTSVFTDSYVIYYIYIYVMLILCHVLFLIFW